MDANAKYYWEHLPPETVFTTPLRSDVFTPAVGRDAAVLDVGCGYGRTLAELDRLGYRNLTGADRSRSLIERGRREYPRLDLRHQAAEALEFPAESFDAALLLAVLTCIPSDAEQRSLCAEIRRVLKPGGILYVNDFLINSDERNRLRYEAAQEKFHCYGVFELPGGAVLRHQKREWVRELFYDWNELRFEELVYPTMNGHTSNGFAALYRK